MRYPSVLEKIPAGYFSEANEQGTLENLYYNTFESFSYSSHTNPLEKRAVVYLPYGYDKSKRYNVVYLMHGGWSNETTYLGEFGRPGAFKNVLDHAIKDGQMKPLIVVCPTYNNTSPEDSGDYSLAIKLTANYHNELANDLLPAVEGTYNTYAESADAAGLEASRDHRAFCGFSMGSVATWRTFEHCLDYFRYFLPSSGSLTTDGDYMAQIVRHSGRTWSDFFIFAASGTDDFAYSVFKAQIEAMANAGDDVFRFANNDADGNLYFLEQAGSTHNGQCAMQYFYNGMKQLWRNNE